MCMCVKTVCIGPDHQLIEEKSSLSQNVTCSYSLDYTWIGIQALSQLSHELGVCFLPSIQPSHWLAQRNNGDSRTDTEIN